MIKGQITCRHCGIGAFTKKMLEALTSLEGRLPKDYVLIAHSVYRCAVHNADCNGSPSSRHMSGEAIDLHCSDLNVIDLLQVVLQVPEFNNGGIGIYTGRREWLHLDVRETKARWAYENNRRISTERFFFG